VDVNLPKYFNLWSSEEYIHQSDIDSQWKDKQIWAYAKEHHLTIISKDSDFSNRIIISLPPPKVIHIKIGNVSMNEFYNIIYHCWEEVLLQNKDYKLVNVYKDRLELIK
ncbi:MAG: DUF5615 family PIN-like protein, partial [Bacteroidota bacterium]